MAINFKTSSHIASILTHAARTVRNGSTLKSAREYMHYQLITRVEAGQVEGADVGHCAGAYASQAVLRSKADFLAHCDREAAYWDDVAKAAIAAQRAAKAARDAGRVEYEQQALPTTDPVELAELFRDWMNNFAAVECFADHHGFTVDQAHAVIAAGRTAHDEQAAPVIEEYRTAVLSTAHMMESDYQILTDNAAQVGSDDGLFWIHDTQAGAILRFKASYYAVGELARLGASRLLIDTILRLGKLGYQAAHFDRDADRVTGWPVDPQYADENE